MISRRMNDLSRVKNSPLVKNSARVNNSLLLNRQKLKKRISMVCIYALLLIFGFVFIYPIVFVLLKSFMPPEDVFNPVVNMVPSRLTWQNYQLVLSRIRFFSSLGFSAYLAGVSSALSALTCGLMGYALSRYRFKLKGLFVALILLAFIIPPQVLMIPTYLNYSNWGILGSPLALFIPALLGQGFQSSIFILIFYSYFNTIPSSLDEASAIDGCSPLQTFRRIILPLSLPIVTLVFIFSVVWYWNETFLTGLYMGEAARTYLNQIHMLLGMWAREAVDNPMAAYINITAMMAGAALMILPLFVFYLVLQRQFVESVDKSGITGE